MGNWNKICLSEWFSAGLAFVYYWILALYKLMDAPIWQDEAMEFYCSVPVRGPIRGVTQYETMYERIAYIQQQPPLYNWLMCLWLQVSENAWWYRFSSVVMGFGAVIGLYLVIKKLCGRGTATVSVVTFSSIYILMYYVKEASEYILLIMLLIWTVYLYLCLLEKITIQRVILFTVLCVVNLYTHYGAAFVMIPMALQLLWHYWRHKDRKAFWTAFLSYIAAGIGAGIPLLYFFLLPQSTNAVTTLGVDKPIEITGNNLLLDFFDSLMWVLRWCMLDYDRDWDKLTWAIWILLFAVLAVSVICFRKTERMQIRYLLCCNVGIFAIYYVLTTLNIYAYGWFGNRYNLFIFPVWFITIAAVLYEWIQILAGSTREWIRRTAPAVRIMVLAGTLLFCCYGVKRIHNHWAKMDLRTVVSVWYEDQGYEIPTFINFHQRYPFVYYLTHNAAYDEAKWDTIYSNQTLETLDFSDEEWIAYLREEVYPQGLPQQVYVVSGQHDTIVEALESIGYQTQAVVDTTAKLFLLTAP